MKKPILWILAAALMTLLIAYQMLYPNAELRAKHQATLCNVVRLSPELNTKAELLQRLNFIYDNSTPTYAYYHPKFYRIYSQYLIQQFLDLSSEQQHIARQDFEQCRQMIDRD